MEQLINKLTDAQKHFIDGMTNQFGDEQELSLNQLFDIMDFCIQRFKEPVLRYILEQRWETITDRDGIFQDIYDTYYDAYSEYFENIK